MKINRQHLLTRLKDYLRSGNGIIIGEPGAGKSYCLDSVCGDLLEEGIPCIILRVDNLLIGDDHEISTELHCESNWIGLLNQINIDKGKGVLVFDAFDAARDEKLKSQLLLQIKKAIQKLDDKWTVAVSVRSYDASKSETLKKILSRSSGNQKTFEIPPLSQDELDLYLTENDSFRILYEKCNAKLKDILRVPFFIKILLEIGEKNGFANVTEVRTAVELLDIYWESEIGSSPNEIGMEVILRHLLNELITNRLLTANSEIITLENDALFRELFSKNIIIHVSANSSRIGFAHNIFFDYAVSKLSLDEDAKKIIEFIQEDRSRPFFLRPSFQYFYTRLWYKRSEMFWTHYHSFLEQNDKYLQLLHQLILCAIIASEFHASKELDPVLRSSNNDLQIQRILRSIMFLEIKYIRHEVVELLETLSEKLNRVFIWEYSMVLDEEIKANADSIAISGILGKCSRSFFEFCFESDDENMTNLAATRGLDFVFATYGSSTESKTCIEKALSNIQKPDFNIWFISSIAENVKNLFELDPLFAGHIYFTIFGYDEKSTEETQMGRSVVLSLRSNRRQDYKLCIYRLIRNFPQFLKTNPEIALRTGLEVFNQQCYQKSYHYYRGDGGGDGNSGAHIKRFYIGPLETGFFGDNSNIWSTHLGTDEPGQLIIDTCKYLEQLIIGKNEKAFQESLIWYFTYSRAAFCWNSLLDLGAKYPPLFKRLFYDLCFVEEIIFSSETCFEAARFIEQVINLIEDEALQDFENFLWGKVDSQKENDGLSHREYSILRFVSVIPYDRLTNKRSKLLLKEQGAIENKPTFSTSITRVDYDWETELSKKGVNIAEPKNSWILKKVKQLTEFNQKYANTVPQRNTYAELLEQSGEIFEVVCSPNVDEKIKNNVATELSHFLSLVTRDIKSLSGYEQQSLMEKIIYFIEHFDMKHSESNMGDSSFAYAPDPRKYASDALANLVYISKDEKVINLFISLLGDKDNIVRLNTANKIIHLHIGASKNFFWEVLFERIKIEPYGLIRSAILISIYRDYIIESELPLFKKALSIASAHLESAEKDESLRDSFIDTYSTLLIYSYHKTNDEELKLLLNDLIQLRPYTTKIVYTIFNFINQDIASAKKVCSLYMQLLTTILHNAVNEYGRLFPVQPRDKPSEYILKNLIEIQDSIIERIYFIVGKDDITGELEANISEAKRRTLYFYFKPLYDDYIKGLQKFERVPMIGHTAYYFAKTMNSVLPFEPEVILRYSHDISQLSFGANYTFDQSALENVVELTNKILADHKILLYQDESLTYLIDLLDFYVTSGWIQALRTLWRLDEAFR